MRKGYETQRTLGSIAIDKVELDATSRHELVSTLRALQHIYSKPRLRDAVLELIEKDVLGGRRSDRGAEGLAYWEVQVLAAVRHGCHLDYDALHDLANNHKKLRAIMGIGPLEQEKHYKYRRIHENVSKVKSATIEAISALVVDAGHKLVPWAIEAVRTDTFVTQTNIHYPSDESLLVDGVRKLWQLGAALAREHGVAGWRDHRYWQKKAKKIARKIQKTRRGRTSNREERQKSLYTELLGVALEVLQRAGDLVGHVGVADVKSMAGVVELEYYMDKTSYVCELAKRRVIEGEQIPNKEKIFSIFEPHTELIKRGKQPDIPEFGHRVYTVEDRAGFVVDFAVLDKGVTDEKVAVERMQALQERMDNRIERASFDRGFWKPKNLTELQKIMKVACLPKKGYLRQEDAERESSAEFVKMRLWHAGIESGIHALMATSGLDRCPDKGSEGYKRYVALGVLGKNLRVLGSILLKRDRKRLRKLKKRKKAS